MTAFFTSLIMIPPVSRLALIMGCLDKPDKRKVHSKETPRLGGIAIFLAFMLPTVLYCKLDMQLKSILAGAAIAFLVGLADDLLNISPRYKLAGQVIAASVVVILGQMKLASLGDPLGLGEIQLGMLSVPFSIFALVGVMNAINLIDGLDGLAGGVSAIACVVLGVISYHSGNNILICLVVALLGGIVAFLNYNTHPARIFLGDCGSLLIGYLLGVFSILLVSGSAGKVSPYIPLIVLALPILDTLAVMANRVRRGVKLFLPDRSHIHHRLLALGVSHKAAVIIAYAMTYLFSMFAVFGQRLEDHHLVGGLLGITSLMYSCLHFCRTYATEKKLLYRNGQPSAENGLKRFADISLKLPSPGKYFLILILMLLVHVPVTAGSAGALVVACPLVLMTTQFFSMSGLGERIFRLVVYFCAGFVIFQIENHGSGSSLFGLPVPIVFNYLFLLLTSFVAVQIFLENKLNLLLSCPLDYLVFFVTLSVPLLPQSFVEEYNLLTVACESIIFFFALKLVLHPNPQKNFIASLSPYAFHELQPAGTQITSARPSDLLNDHKTPVCLKTKTGGPP